MRLGIVMAIAILVALEVSTLGAHAVLTAKGSSLHSSCVVNTPRGTIALPAQACRHVPTFWGSSCILVTGRGQVIYLPRQACAHGPHPGRAVSAGPADCVVNTPRGAISLPAQACQHIPTLWGANCILVTDEGQIIYLPMQACTYSPQPAPPPSSGPSGCVVNAPGGAITLPAQACQHVPTFWGSSCILVTGEGQIIYLPTQACTNGPQPAPPPSSGPSGCVINTPGGTIVLPAEACQRIPTLWGANCILVTDEGQIIYLPMQACIHHP
jgi:hypothetical protein